MGARVKTEPARCRPLIASFFAGYVAFAILSGIYFFVVPAATMAAAAVCLGGAWWFARDQRANN